MIKKFNEFCKQINEALNGMLDDSALTPVTGSSGRGGHKLNRMAADAYERMREAAEEDGVTWTISDSYRDYEEQVEVAKKKGIYGQGGLAATPGKSNHGWGSALDLNLGKGEDYQKTLDWLKNNAEEFGFSTISGEPWHWEHKASASQLKSAGGISEAPTKVLIDSDFVNRLIDRLKEKNFSQEDLEKFSKKKTSVVSLTSSEDEAFYEAVLKSLGANSTPEKIKFLKAWRQAEGGTAANNPFNTTKRVAASGVTDYNSVGVKNYPTRQVGLDATVATLKLPYYKDLLSKLMDDSSTASEIASSPDLKTWGTGSGVERVLAGRSINPPAIA